MSTQKEDTFAVIRQVKNKPIATRPCAVFKSLAQRIQVGCQLFSRCDPPIVYIDHGYMSFQQMCNREIAVISNMDFVDSNIKQPGSLESGPIRLLLVMPTCLHLISSDVMT
jgi:hypothetical protein